MKPIDVFLIAVIISAGFIISCKKDKNNNRTTLHENLYPRKMIYLKIDSISGEEDTFSMIDYYKQSNVFDYDSIGYRYYNSSFTKLRVNSISANTYEIIPDDPSTLLGFQKLNEITYINNNITQLLDNYTDCISLGSFAFDYKYDLQFDSVNRIKSYSYNPYLTRCGGFYSTAAAYRFSNNEDTCFVNYQTEACTAEDTIIYYNDNHRSSIPFLSYTYLFMNPCSARSFTAGSFTYAGFDLYRYSDYQYKLIKEVRLSNPFASISYRYTYQFNSDDNVSEVLVKPSIYIGLQDYKIKFYY